MKTNTAKIGIVCGNSYAPWWLVSSKALAFVAIAFLFSFGGQRAWSYGSGTSSHPLPVGKKLLTAEFMGITSSEGGVGFQMRFAKKVNPGFFLEGGMGMSGGAHSSRLFVGADWEIFPDYGNQPRFSLQGRIINAKEFGLRRNKISIAPSLGKGFSLKSWVFYPYLAFPYSISLAGDKTYETFLDASLGLTCNLPFRGYEHIVGSLGTSVGVRNSFVGFVAGLSWPIE